MSRLPGMIAFRCFWLLFAAVMFYPVFWMIWCSLKGSNLELFEHPWRWPQTIHLENYRRAWTEGRLAQYLINSIWVTSLTCLAVATMGMATGWAMSRRRIPGSLFWYMLFILGLILPIQAYLIPLIDWVEWLGVHDSLWALILPYTAQSLPIGVLLFAAYYRSLPGEMEEASRMEGASTWQFYVRVLWPLSRPVTGTVVVLTCLHTWNEFLMALLLIVDPSRRTLPVGLIAFEQAHRTDYPVLLAALTLISVPSLLVYAWYHRQIIRGVIAGSVK